MAGYWFGKKRPGTNWRKTPVKIGDQWYTPKGEKVRNPEAYWATINRRGRFWVGDTGWVKKDGQGREQGGNLTSSSHPVQHRSWAEVSYSVRVASGTDRHGRTVEIREVEVRKRFVSIRWSK